MLTAVSMNKTLYTEKRPWLFVFTVVWFLSFTSRYFGVEKPDNVCWDEVHFGKMGSYYINRTFFFDVHPPLGKMLIGLSGTLTGYDGSFQFYEPGDSYGNTSYVGMRVTCATAGALLPVLCFSIVWKLSNSLNAAVLSSSMVLLDTGCVCLSQYILLDPLLLCFITAAVWAHVNFLAQSHRPFSGPWWLWLASTGFFLALSVGVKFVGLFTVALIGVSVVVDLWILLGDLTLSMRTLWNHVMARVLCLIALPVVIYLVIFLVHFKVLIYSGNEDGFFSSAFQSQLIGNQLYNISMPHGVAFGSVVSIKNQRPGGGYLHSHHHLYPGTTDQQQVTAYSHQDDNNLWKMRPWNQDDSEADSVVLVHHGNLVRLQHVMTGKNLHSHRESALVTAGQQQVTCYGSNGTGDANDVFRINLLNMGGGLSVGDTRVSAVTTTFQLLHVETGCSVQSHSTQLPAWGFEQMEVTCSPNVNHPNSHWNVEEVHDTRLKNESFEVFAPSFWQKLVESHIVMFQSNAALKPDEEEVSSAPWQWPLNYKGQPFCSDPPIYLLGNPVIWWSCLCSLVVSVALLTADTVLRKRRILKRPKSKCLQSCQWLLMAWLFHYLPFWLMTRVLYFHHYFPAYLFSAMLSGMVIDLILQYVDGWLRTEWFTNAAVVCILAVFTYSFYVFSFLCYGTFASPLEKSPLRWLSSWDF